MTNEQLQTIIDLLQKQMQTDPENAPQEPENELATDTTELTADITNGAIKDNTDAIKDNEDITDALKTDYEETAQAQETTGAQEVLAQSIDERFATYEAKLTQALISIDALQVDLARIMTHIDLIEDVTDNFVTIDHDALLTASIKSLI